MATAVILPKFGFTLEESEIVEWLVAEGETVREGDPLAEVTTDKVNMEVEAPCDGIVAGLRYAPGEVVPVTEIIAYVLEPGESLADVGEPAGVASTALTAAISSAAQTDGGGVSTITPVAARMAAEHQIELGALSGSGAGGKIVRADVEAYLRQPNETLTQGARVRATPAARRIARENDVDLRSIAGTGARGRVQADDVVRYLAQAPTLTTPVTPQPGTPAAVETPAADVVPLSRMRESIANNLQRSWQQAPHIMFAADIEMDAVMNLVADANQTTKRVNLTAVLLKATAWALQQHPRLNAHLLPNGIRQHNDVNLGVAVALDDGLVVPVIHNVPQLGLVALTEHIRDVATRARSGKLKLADLQGATFSVSNLGMYGIDRFTAILNPPEVGILAIGRTQAQFVPDADGAPRLALRSSMTLSVDHRAIDGAVAAQFMQSLRQAVEYPLQLLY